MRGILAATASSYRRTSLPSSHWATRAAIVASAMPPTLGDRGAEICGRLGKQIIQSGGELLARGCRRPQRVADGLRAVAQGDAQPTEQSFRQVSINCRN